MLLVKDVPARDFLLQWHKTLPQKPTAILIISAHWDTYEPAVNTVSKNSTIYDFYGFPSELYKMQYNAPGAPALARRVKELLHTSGFKTVHEDSKRGLDHGAWVPLKLMYPKEDVPVCQLSVQPNRDGAHHYRLGQALAPLRQEGVLIIGSGSATHNLRSLRLDGSPTPSWALEFDDWLHQSLADGRFDDVIHYENKAPHARRVHPSPEHFYPMLVALGAAGARCRASRIHSSWMASSLSMANFVFK